jgi:hypothetical protein
VAANTRLHAMMDRLAGAGKPRKAVAYQATRDGNESVQFMPPQEADAPWRLRLARVGMFGAWAASAYLFLYHDWADKFDSDDYRRGEYGALETFRYKMRRGIDGVVGVSKAQSSIVREMKKRHPGCPLPDDDPTAPQMEKTKEAKESQRRMLEYLRKSRARAAEQQQSSS